MRIVIVLLTALIFTLLSLAVFQVGVPPTHLNIGIALLIGIISCVVAALNTTVLFIFIMTAVTIYVGAKRSPLFLLLLSLDLMKTCGKIAKG